MEPGADNASYWLRFVCRPGLCFVEVLWFVRAFFDSHFLVSCDGGKRERSGGMRLGVRGETSLDHGKDSLAWAWAGG